MGTFNFFYLGVVLFNSRGNTFANNQASREPLSLAVKLFSSNVEYTGKPNSS